MHCFQWDRVGGILYKAQQTALALQLLVTPGKVEQELYFVMSSKLRCAMLIIVSRREVGPAFTSYLRSDVLGKSNCLDDGVLGMDVEWKGKDCGKPSHNI